VPKHKEILMDNRRMMTKLAQLPAAELLQASALSDPPGSDVFYSGRTVVLLLDKERPKWQGIETAPRDGADVLVYARGSYAVAHWDGSEWRDIGDIGWAGMHGDGSQPTHWLPLLPPCAA